VTVVNIMIGVVVGIAVTLYFPEIGDRVRELTHNTASAVADITDKPVTDRIIDKFK
jgi:uncharacterized membrane protein YgaE (UPF0421/DUF939 family)